MLAPDTSLLTQVAAEFAEADRLEALAAANLVEATLHRLAGARLLSKIKRSGVIPHGQWLPWLKSHFTLKPRTLQEYMEMAEYFPPAKAQRVAHLGVKGMLALMRQEQRAKKKPPPSGDFVFKDTVTVLRGDCRTRLKELRDGCAHVVICSPPYFNLRSFEVEPTVWGGDQRNCSHAWIAPSEYSTCGKCGAWRGAPGLEPDPGLYVEHLVECFDEVWRVLRDDGTLWVVIGDSYNNSGPGANPGAGGIQGAAMRANPAYDRAVRAKGAVLHTDDLKPKDLIGVPWELARALRKRGWYLRAEIIWAKGSCLPESCRDRPTHSHETIFLLSKRPTYFYNSEAIKEFAVSTDDPRFGGGRKTYGGKYGEAAFVTINEKRNCRDVWSIPTEPFRGDHYACFPKALVKPMVLAGCPEGGTALDLFAGTGTTGLVANALGRRRCSSKPPPLTLV
jgi:DNA modification methylase